MDTTDMMQLMRDMATLMSHMGTQAQQSDAQHLQSMLVELSHKVDAVHVRPFHNHWFKRDADSDGIQGAICRF